MKKHLQLLLIFCISTTFAQDAVPISLYEQFYGQVNFTEFGNTLITDDNFNNIDLNIPSESDAELTLNPGQTVIAAYLYWAANFPTEPGGIAEQDFSVALNGIPVTATRTFLISGGFFANPFSGFADVTAIVQAEGNGTYTFSELESPPENYNGASSFAGWSVVVVYEDLSSTQNQVSIYDGFDYLSEEIDVNFTLNSLDIASTNSAKISFLTWEGDMNDPTVSMESLSVNGMRMSNALNPINQVFNGTNGFSNNPNNYQMDLDLFDVGAAVNTGDTSVDVALTTTLDVIAINHVITVFNSEVPDASIEIDGIGVLCENNDIDVNYTVLNINSTEDLPPGVPIAFYADGVLVGQTTTAGIIPIDGSESGTITLNFPPSGGTPVVFTLTAVVDDDGTGNGTIMETNENNNEDELLVDLSLQGLDLGPDLLQCLNDIVSIGQDLGPTFTYQWFLNGVALTSAGGPFINPTQTGTYRLDAFQGICFVTDEIEITFRPNPIAVVPDDIELCDDGPLDGFAIFDLTQRIPQIENGQAGTSVTFHTTEALADIGAFPFVTPDAFTNTTASFQTVWARLVFDATGCDDLVPLNLIVNDSPSITSPISDYFLCDLDGDGFETFDLTSKDAEILNTLVDVDLSYHESELDAQNNTAPIVPADAYVSSNTVVWVRAVNYENGDPNGAELCTTVGSFNLVLGQVPVFNVLPEITACDDEI
ncbi:CARDB domain-containing protein, partial [Patiriisocius marinistellae]|uniref:CARDB domain-containing protein n=1 Tax=Patiriisocius marinistellae TaxID=2494560 RepID=UPI00125E398E